MRKRHPDPKVPVGNVRELSETFTHKAKPFEPGVRRRLRKARSEERLEELDPIGGIGETVTRAGFGVIGHLGCREGAARGAQRPLSTRSEILLCLDVSRFKP